MAEYKGMTNLKNKLSGKQSRVALRYEYYEMKNLVNDFSPTAPPELQWMKACLGWCTKAVDSIADRLIFREFRDEDREDMFDLNAIFDANNPDTLFDSAVLSAVIASCSFVYISAGEDGYPRLQVIDGGNATGIIDPITGMLKEGYAVLERDSDTHLPTIEAYFVPGRTDYVYKGISAVESISNPAPYPLLVPIIYRPDNKRAFGHSRISRACMNITQEALRTLKRSEISAEFYSFPQKYALGISQDLEIDKWRATMSSMLTLTRDEDGNVPTVGQFQQQSMTPYIEQMKMFASLFAAETGLTIDDLGFVSDNPSSAEAIKASHENLRLTARKAQRTFGSGFLNVGYLAACVRDNFPYERRQISKTHAIWEPIFEPDAAMLSSIGDGAIKINQAVPGYFGRDNLRDLIGIDASTLPVQEAGQAGTDSAQAAGLELNTGV